MLSAEPACSNYFSDEEADENHGLTGLTDIEGESSEEADDQDGHSLEDAGESGEVPLGECDLTAGGLCARCGDADDEWLLRCGSCKRLF